MYQTGTVIRRRTRRKTILVDAISSPGSNDESRSDKVDDSSGVELEGLSLEIHTSEIGST